MNNLIKSIEFLPIDVKASNWSQNTCIVKVTDEQGLYGIGEADGSPASIAMYANSDNEHKWLKKLTELLVGKDPIEFEANWNNMYESTRWIGQRGFGMFAISGIDMALYDLVGKQYQLPVYKLLGGALRDKVTPYFTLFPDVASDAHMSEVLNSYAPLFDAAKEKNVKAVKVAVMQDAVMTKQDVVSFVKECRRMIGYDIDLMVDFLYRFDDWQDIKWVLNKLESTDLYFAEAVLSHDDLKGHARLANSVSTRICGAEMSTTRFEAQQWLEQSGVSIIQPDYNRSGGFTELRKIVTMAEQYNVQVMPHNWKTGITSAASKHFQIANKHAEYVEYVHPDFYNGALRKNLTTNEAPIVDGYLTKPETPGLGIDINRDYFKEVTGTDF